MNDDVRYVLTLTSSQAKEVRDAVELLMRLKLGQYNELPYRLCNIGANDYCERRDKAEPYLKVAFEAMQAGKGPTDWKDDEWHRLYGIFQVLRHAIFKSECPDGSLWSVASDTPRMTLETEPLPKIEVVKGDK